MKCPKCHEEGLKIIPPVNDPASLFTGKSDKPIYVCEKCGYKGPFVLEKGNNSSTAP